MSVNGWRGEIFVLFMKAALDVYRKIRFDIAMTTEVSESTASSLSQIHVQKQKRKTKDTEVKQIS